MNEEKYQCQTPGLHELSMMHPGLQSCIGCTEAHKERYSTIIQFLKIQACFSTSEETLKKLAEGEFGDYTTFRSKIALATRELLRKIGELNDRKP